MAVFVEFLSKVCDEQRATECFEYGPKSQRNSVREYAETSQYTIILE